MQNCVQICRKRFCCFFTSGRTTVWIFNLLAEVILGGGVIYSWLAKEDPTDALFATAALTGIALVCSVTLLLSDLMRTKLCGSSARNCLYEWAGCMASGAARFFLFLLGASAAFALSQATAEVRELNGVWTTNAHSVLIVAALVGAMAALANATVGLRLWMRGAETCCDPDANLEDLEKGMTSTEVIQLKNNNNNNNQTITGDRKMTTTTSATTTPESTTTSSSGASKGDGASKSTRGDDEQFAQAVVSYLIAHPDVAIRVLSSVATDSGYSNNVAANSSQTQGGTAVITNNAARATRVAFLSGSGASSSSSSSSSSTTPAESISGAAVAVKSDNPFLRAIGFGGGSSAGSSSSTATSAAASAVNSVSSTSTTLAPVDASTSSAPLPPAGYRGAVAPNPFIAAIQNNNNNGEVSAVSQSSPLPPPGRQNRFISYAGDNPFKD